MANCVCKPALGNNPDWHMRVYQVGETGRETIERYIAMRYASDFGAKLDSFYPHLLAVKQDEARVVAALGYRRAEEGPLFLEQYLSRPVESSLAGALNMPVVRDGMLEIGNLASDFSGGNRVLISTLTAYLYGKSARWVVFTGTRALLNSFRRFAIDVYDLGEASLDRLQTNGAHWGSYYDHRPRVVAVNVAQAYWAIRGRLQSPHRGIWAEALRCGFIQGVADLPETALGWQFA